MSAILYGDGLHDDTAAIQEMIDNAGVELRLPLPKVRYLISAPLELPSNFKLSLPRFAEIKLAKGSDCVMLMNKTVKDIAKRKNAGIFDYVNIFSPDVVYENIEVEGGIWNYNNKEQSTNPLLVVGKDGKWHWGPNRKQIENDVPKENLETMNYNGYIFLFYSIKNLKISSLTLKDPITFAVTIDKVSYFTVSDIVFDYNHGNPLACNMDGIHVNGNCHYGSITNLQGACHDDLVALNADEGSGGPIDNITIRGIYAENCHSAIRLLSTDYSVKNIHISDIHGMYYQYCVGITRYYTGSGTGAVYDGITIDNVYASKAERLDVYNHVNDWVFSIIHIDSYLHIKTLKISELHRREYINPVATFFIDKETQIDHFVLDNITTENYAGGDMPLFVNNNATVKQLCANEIYVDGKAQEVKL